MSYNSPSDSKLDAFLAMIWQRKVLVISLVILFVFAGWLLLQFVKPRYTAEGAIRLNNVEQATVLSEALALKSRTFLNHVVREAELITDKELNTLLSRNLERGEVNSSLAFISADELLTGRQADTRNNLLDQVTTNMQKNLVVLPVENTNVMRIQYTSEDPEKAANIVNTLIDSYVMQKNRSMASPAEAEDKEAKLAQLRRNLESSEQALETFRLNNKPLQEETQSEVETQKLLQLHTKLVVAKAEYEEALQTLQQNEKGPLFSVAASSPLLQELRGEYKKAERAVSKLSERYGYKHPKMKQAERELADLKVQIEMEAKSALSALKKDIQRKQERIEALEAEISGFKAPQSDDRQPYQQQLNALLREVETNRMLYERYAQMYQATVLAGEGTAPTATILSYAITPIEPSFPNHFFFLSWMAGIGFLVAVWGCLVLRSRDDAFHDRKQVEEMTSKPCFVMLPKVEKLSGQELSEFILTRPAFGLAEAVRTLRMALKWKRQKNEQASCVVSVTSSLPGEGKTTLSVWLAKLAAKSGEKVIIIDADLRRPSVHKLLPGRGKDTLVDYLTGQAKLEQIISMDKLTGLHKIYARSVPTTAMDLIGSDKMKYLLESLRKVYDLIIIDTPATMVAPDAAISTKLSDHALYCIHWEKTKREDVLSGLKELEIFGEEEVFCTLTNVDMSRFAAYGYNAALYNGE